LNRSKPRLSRPEVIRLVLKDSLTELGLLQGRDKARAAVYF